MAKRIYDILPPKMASKKEESMKAVAEAVVKSKRLTTRKSSPKKDLGRPAERKVPLKEMFIGGVVILALFGVYLYNKLPKAEVLVSPPL